MTDSRPARILVIDDEAPIRRFLAIVLGAGGFEMLEADRGRLGIERAATMAPDAVLLDLGLPDIDGKAVIEAIREWSGVPILVLSVRDAETEKIAALDAGADDYVTKPFSTGELLARLRALLRSRRDRAAEPSAIRIGGLEIDLASRAVSVDGAPARLTRKEFDVVALLARNAGKLVGHKQLLTTVWGPAHTADTHYLRVAIGHIREKIGDDAADPRFIVTEPGSATGSWMQPPDRPMTLRAEVQGPGTAAAAAMTRLRHPAAFMARGSALFMAPWPRSNPAQDPKTVRRAVPASCCSAGAPSPCC